MAKKDKKRPVPQPSGGRSNPNPGAFTAGTGKPVAPKAVLRMHTDNDDDELCHPVWRLTLLDRDFQGSWSWGITAEDLDEIVSFLTQMEGLTWREIREQKTPSAGGRMRPKHHPQDVDTLCQEAQDRLLERKLDEVDELFRFRVGSRARLWGLLSLDTPRVFYPIWYDLHHKVYPTNHD